MFQNRLLLPLLVLLVSCEPIVLKDSMEQQVAEYLESRLGTVEAPKATVQGTLADAASGTYSTDATITLTSSTPGALIHYTVDGTEPTESSPSAPNPVPLAGDGTSFTLKAIASKAGYRSSDVFQATYRVEYLLLATPIFSPPPGDYSSDTLITLTSTSGANLRYTTDGISTPSATFGNLYTGPFALPPNSTTSFQALATLAGWHNSHLALGTYTSHPAGTPDTAFGSSGTANGNSGTITALGVQSDGSVVGVGWNVWNRSTNGIYRRIILTRANTTGGGMDVGYLRFREGAEFPDPDLLTSDAHAIVVQPDDKVVVAGWLGLLDSSSAPTSEDQVWAVLRFSSSILTLETTFESFGAVSPSRATALVMDAETRLVAAGVSNGHLTLARYLPSGALDASFGTSGSGYTETSVSGTPFALVRNPTGTWTALLTDSATGSKQVISVRFSSGGAVDTSYGTGGIATVNLPNVFNTKFGAGSLTAAAGQSDGKIVFVGNGTNDANIDHPQVVGRLTTTGALDVSFGTGGYAAGFTAERLPLSNPFPPGFNEPGNVQWDEPRSVAISPTGKILVSGTTKIFNAGAVSLLGTQLNLTRYTPGGNLDSSFNGVSGYVLRPGAGEQDEWNAVLLQPNGEILVAGRRGHVVPNGVGAYMINYGLSLSRFW